jgi:uncharacterized repeat protein (TIGR01451 family)
VKLNHALPIAIASAAMALFAPVGHTQVTDVAVALASLQTSPVVRGTSNCPVGSTVIYNTTHASTQGAEIASVANGVATCMGDQIVTIDHTLPVCEITADIFTLAATTPFDLTVELYTDCTTNGTGNSPCGNGVGTLIPGSTVTVPNITPPALGTIFTVVFPMPNIDISAETDNIFTVKLRSSRSDVFWRIGETAAVGSQPDAAPSVVQRCGSAGANNGCTRNFGVTNNFAMSISAGTPPAANLGIVKTDSADPVTGGANFDYTLAVSNAGPDSATNVVVTDVLPAGTTFVSATGTGWTCNELTGTVTCTQASLAVGAANPITITVTTANATALLSNTATVDADETDGTPADNSDTETTNVVSLAADVGIVKTDSADPVTGGTNFSYTLAVDNAGPDSASNLVVTDVLPAGVTFVSATGTGWTCNELTGTVTCTQASLAVGAANPITITVTTADVTSLLSNTATVAADETDGTPANNSDTEDTNVVAAQADLAIVKTDSADPVTLGSNFSYTLSVTNAGPNAATNVSVVDVLPAGLTFVSATGTGWTCGEAAGTVTCTLPTLAVGAAAPITLTVTAPNAPTTISNVASVDADQADPNGGNSSATQGTAIAAPFVPEVPVPALGAGGAVLLALSILLLMRARSQRA